MGILFKFVILIIIVIISCERQTQLTLHKYLMHNDPIPVDTSSVWFTIQSFFLFVRENMFSLLHTSLWARDKDQLHKYFMYKIEFEH